MNTEIVTESEALDRIKSAIESLDIDDLANLLSEITSVGTVIVVPDGNEDLTLTDIVKNNIPCSEVHQDGKMFGYIDEKGEVIEIDDRFQIKDASEQHYGEIIDALDKRTFKPIVDESSGYTVGFIHADHDYLVKYLNR
jgi:hypothetical protein